MRTRPAFVLAKQITAIFVLCSASAEPQNFEPSPARWTLTGTRRRGLLLVVKEQGAAFVWAKG